MFNRKTHLILCIVSFIIPVLIICAGLFANEETLKKYYQLLSVGTVLSFFFALFLHSKISRNF